LEAAIRFFCPQQSSQSFGFGLTQWVNHFRFKQKGSNLTPLFSGYNPFFKKRLLRPRLAAGNDDYDNEGRYLFFRLVAFKGEEPPDTGGGRVFSLDAALGLLATRRRLAPGAPG